MVLLNYFKGFTPIIFQVGYVECKLEMRVRTQCKQSIDESKTQGCLPRIIDLHQAACSPCRSLILNYCQPHTKKEILKYSYSQHDVKLTFLVGGINAVVEN